MSQYIVTWIHLVAVVTLIGGLIFANLVFNPVVQGLSPGTQSGEIRSRVGRRFQTVSWVSLITLILTGSFQMLNESGSSRIETIWGVVLMVKLFVFALIFGLMMVHDFILEPYKKTIIGDHSKKNRSVQKGQLFFVQQTILFLSLTVLLIASYLSTL